MTMLLPGTKIYDDYPLADTKRPPLTNFPSSMPHTFSGHGVDDGTLKVGKILTCPCKRLWHDNASIMSGNTSTVLEADAREKLPYVGACAVACASRAPVDASVELRALPTPRPRMLPPLGPPAFQSPPTNPPGELPSSVPCGGGVDDHPCPHR